MLALRNTKIPRDIYTACNRFYGKTDFTSFTNKAPEKENVQFNEIRHIVTNTTKPAVLPKFDFPPVEPQRRLLSEMQHLQPARQSKFISVTADYTPLNGYEPRAELNQHKSFIVECPFPRPIIEPQHNAMTFTERTKKRTPFVKPPLNQSARHYSTSPFVMVARGFAKKKQDDEKCEKPKKPCRKDSGCPHFVPKDCKASSGSHCEHYYIDPKCTKKLAPYKSYSETCHEILEDDPSECFQCPWQKCRGIESIKPPKRKYHTWRQCSAAKSASNMNMLSTSVSGNNLTTVSIECDAKKKPCKPPPPKCVKKEKTKKCPPLTKNRKKKCEDESWPEIYQLWCQKENAIPGPTWMMPGDLWCVREHFFPPTPWMTQGGLCCVTCDSLGTQLPVNAHLTGCECDTCKREQVIRMLHNVVYRLKDQDCPKDKGKCPPVDLPNPPEIDRTIDERFGERDPCCQRTRRERVKSKKRRIEKHAIKEHDKGHPPPCPVKKHQSKQCPKKISDDLPYKKQRDLTHPTYRRNPYPYSDEDLKK